MTVAAAALLVLEHSLEAVLVVDGAGAARGVVLGNVLRRLAERVGPMPLRLVPLLSLVEVDEGAQVSETLERMTSCGAGAALVLRAQGEATGLLTHDRLLDS